MTTVDAILILGMHRSGTSALASAAVALGAIPPRELYPASAQNSAGYWESPRIVRINQSLLAGTGHDWFDCMTFDSRLFTPSARAQIRGHIDTLLPLEFASARPMLIKDPRLSLMLELWHPSLPGSAVLLSLRHPDEVVASLQRRDRCERAVGLALWLHYTLEGERQSRDWPRAMVSYDRLLLDWRAAMLRAAAQAGLTWPRSLDSLPDDTAPPAQPGLRHHQAEPLGDVAGPEPLCNWAAETWRILRECEASGANADLLRSLDEVRAAFEWWRKTQAPRFSRVAAN